VHVYLLVHGGIVPVYYLLILVVLTFRTDCVVGLLFLCLFGGFVFFACVSVCACVPWAMLPDLN